MNKPLFGIKPRALLEDILKFLSQLMARLSIIVDDEVAMVILIIIAIIRDDDHRLSL